MQLELRKLPLLAIVLLSAMLLGACQGLPSLAPNVVESTTQYQISISVDGETRTVISEGRVVRDVLREQTIELGLLDRIEPGEFTPLEDNLVIDIVRIQEVTEIEEVEIAFEKQLVRNEGLAEGETRLLQTGIAGVEEVTYKIVFEDGIEVGRTVTRRELVQESVPEIQMVGIQTSITAIDVPGTMAYLSAGNAWLVSENTGERTPLTTTGDLDGRVFSLSRNGKYLLYTKSTGNPLGDLEDFNTLWVLDTRSTRSEPIPMDVVNVLWADWAPDLENTIAYSTAQPTLVSPGWDADNNLLLRAFTADGSLSDEAELIVSDGENASTIYGTRYMFSSNGQYLAFSNATQVGWVLRPDLTDVLAFDEPEDESDEDTEDELPADPPEPVVISVPSEKVVLQTFAAYDTKSDWSWIPDVSWSGNNQFIYTVNHGEPIGLETITESQVFDVMAVSTTSDARISFVSQSGMWAAPSPAPSGETIAYLQAMRPLESVTSRYRLVFVDRDGSNPEIMFPADGQPGLTAQPIVWSPDGQFVSLIYAGDLWVLDVNTSQAQPITADGQTSIVSWSN